MLRDASQKQTIQKFSFIENLTLPQTKSTKPEVVEEIDVGQAFNFVPQGSLKSSPSATEIADTMSQEDYALVTAVKSANLANNPHSASETSYPGIAEIIKYSGLNQPVDNNAPQKNNYLGKILFALASSYALFVVWWLFGHQGTKFMTHMMGGKHITLSQSDVEFIDYVERSLVSLDRQSEAKKSNSDEDKVVFVPVYTPKNEPPVIPAPVVEAEPQPLPTPAASTSQALKIPAPPPLPAPNSIPDSAPSTSTNIESVAAKPVIKHTLTGILDLGVGKSAALIKTDGQTRRFWQGEEINNSGWILESVTNQSAKINYQGKVRSIAVGETF